MTLGLSARLITVLALGVVACGGGFQSSTATLRASMESFHEGVRWQRGHQASSHVTPPARSAFFDAYDDIAKDARFTDIEIVVVDMASADTADAKVRYEWYLDSHGTVEKTTVRETWRKQGDVWWLVGSRHLEGTPLPWSIDMAADPRDARPAAAGPLDAPTAADGPVDP